MSQVTDWVINVLFFLLLYTLNSGSGNLASYQPAFIGIGSFELGITKTSARTPSANFRPEQMDLPLVQPAALDDTNPWSKTSGAGPDLLF